jgi:hypothetical protein
MELLLELLLAEVLAIAVHLALGRLLAWIREPSGARARLALQPAA